MSTDNGTPWTPVALPYFVNSGPVDKLPSAEDIRGCTDVLHERFRAKIVAVSQQIVAKFGGDVLKREGQALIYLERHVPKVPAPRLYAMYYHEEELFLVMQRAPGVQVEKLWPSLTSSEKQFIVAELHNIFHQLREAVCPAPAYFGGLAGEGVNHHLFFNQKDDDQDLLGPFHGEAAFLEGLASNFRASRERNGHPAFKVQFWDEHLGTILRDLRPTLTHGDVQRRNVVVAERTDCSVEGGQRTFDVFLVDWEMAGWLPRFWEFFIASKRYHFTDLDEDWWCYLGKFLDVRLGEAATLAMFEQDYG
ncbi:hypothetical protein CBER1_04330 [Cercospora berteroae]|uniref:Aminoglycoside phosphotransferase domain-containing protein n=1 Tax=Cercospora berteroae TaxID=357750 RepID=A0A2S6CJ76_9PEZI|nr:hypothetical protein CBER1_04330 [Cercospora berteroae]